MAVRGTIYLLYYKSWFRPFWRHTRCTF